ncbi:hypothetical protein O6H91_Y465100 [Diphasiastrum complanatum]|nr:hypothetical protein O6H91_Y465100 [Diphasiastrum complanatum]
MLKSNSLPIIKCKCGNLPIPSDSVRKKFLLPIILLSIIVGALLLLISVACIVFYLKKRHHDPRSILFDKEEKQQCFTSLMSHSSRSTEEFQIYDNSCFHMAAGCIGKQASRKVERPDPVLGMATQRYLYSELSDATGGFCESNLIGVGGSSMVYHGKLKDGRPVAVKRLNFFTGPEIEHEFLLEVELLSRLHHFHLVSLLGYCSEIKGKEIQRILVYDFMENGNLREHLSNVGNKTLNWDTRLQIAVGAARGLEYLHEAADPRVLHRDFKSQNILLDYKWRAKVADFGMAKVIESSDFTGCTNSPAQMLGTFGYLAPEYATTGKATTKSDVFSFGVVLLELISARQSLDILSPKGEQSLVQWALPMLHDREWVVNNLVDPELGHHCSSELVQQVALIAQACLQADPDLRPSMTSVVQALSRLLSKPTGDVETEISASPDTQILGKDSSSRYREPDLLDCSTITPERFNVRTTYPYVSMRDRDNDQKVVDVLSLDEDMRRQKSAVLRRTTSLSGAENFLGSGAILSPSNPIRRCFEEEALDLLKPRLEYFWLHGERMER